MWLTLMRADVNVPVDVNMERVTFMWRVTNATELIFDKEFALLVNETPEEIRGHLQSLTSEPKPIVDRM